jgi:hypothetical protein
VASWVPHLILPPLVALAFFRSWPRKWVLWLAPTTFLAELDFILPAAWAEPFGMDHFHRAATHTFLIPAAIVLAVWWHARRNQVAFPEYALRPGWPLAGTLVAYYLVSHSIMDIFAGGVVLLWPLWNLNWYVDLRIDINLQTRELLPTAETGTSEGPFQLDPAYPWFTNEHAAMLAFALAALLAWAALAWWRKSAPPSTKGK